MRTIRIKVFKFNELSTEAQKVAIAGNDDINVFSNWWEYMYGDAEETAGLKLTGFDLDNNTIEGELIEGAQESADLIIENHGEETDTYELAQKFQKDWSELVAKHSDGIQTDKVAEGNENDFDAEADALEQKYLKDLLSSYLKMLRDEYEYLISDEAIKETLSDDAMNYEFTQDGNRFHK